MSVEPRPDIDAVTALLLTDVEGSTALWELHQDLMREVLTVHDRIVRAAVEENGGSLLQARGEGDSTFSAEDLAQQPTTSFGRD